MKMSQRWAVFAVVLALLAIAADDQVLVRINAFLAAFALMALAFTPSDR